jgi:hypothetical protein
MRQRAIEAKAIQDLAKEYGVPAETISDVSLNISKLGTATQPTEEGEVTEDGAEGVPAGQVVSDISLNGAQVASLINIINAVAAGALSKEGAVSVITAAFPTISREQAISIVGGVQEGKIVPTTKEERIASQEEGGEESSGGSPKEPTPAPTEPSGEAQKKSNLEALENLNPEELKMLIAGMMGGIELGKYDGIDFTPPQGAREAAKRALDVREGKPASQKGMTPVGIARARDLMNGVKLSPDTVRRMKAFFDRHEVDKKGATWDEQGKGWQAWNGWGGDAGYAWARKVVRQMESRDKELSAIEFVAGRDCGQDDEGTFGPDNKCAVGYGRPATKGGYDPKRPGGKIPKDYKRPTPQSEKKEKPKKKDVEPPPTPKRPDLPPPRNEKEKAERYARSLGIEKVELPENEENAQDIRTSLEQLKSKGYQIPPPYQIFTDDIEQRYGSSFQGSYAVAHQEEGSLKNQIIYSKNSNTESFRSSLANDEKDGWLTSTNLFAHEYGHNAHHNKLSYEKAIKYSEEGFGAGDIGLSKMKIAQKVSNYAAKNPMEFVAETFAGHISGKTFSKDVYDLYNEYEGPDLK